MSNFSYRGRHDYMSMDRQNGLSFSDTMTNPENVASIMRRLLSSSGDNLTKRRAYNMFMNLNRFTSSKPDQATLSHQYSEIVRAIFKNFISLTGKYTNPSKTDVKKFSNDIRYKVITALKLLTGCGYVNVCFKDSVANMIFDEKISFYINNKPTEESSIPFKISSVGVTFADTTTLTVVIPMKYVENMINQAYGQCQSEMTRLNIKPDVSNVKIVSLVLERLTRLAGCDIYNSIIAALYKDIIFSQFARDTIAYAKTLIKYNITSNAQITFQSNTSLFDIPSLNFDMIRTIFKEDGISEINPNVMLDMFEISDAEISSFVSNFVRSDENRDTKSPKIFYLRNEKEFYVDEESSICASEAFITRLNYIIIALMLMTKNSIKEGTRSKYVSDIRYRTNYIRSGTKGSFVTNQKQLICDEIDAQLDIMDGLASDIIKLKRHAVGDYNKPV